VTSITCFWPGFSVKDVGEIETASPPSPLTDELYVAGPPPTFVTVRLTVCTPARSPIAIDGTFKSLGSSEKPAVDNALQAEALTPVVVPQRNANQSLKPALNTSPGSIALFGRTCPAPCLKITSGFVLGPSSTSYAVVINADLIIIGVQVGCRSFSNAARPATCGLDIEVPL